jgi:hypothetical protein
VASRIKIAVNEPRADAIGSVVASKGTRARNKRREERRALVKEIRAREKLNRVSAGGSPGRAIEVSTPSVIAPIVRSTACHQCAGELEPADIAARSTDSGPRRVAITRCRRCHAPREIWFAIGPTMN